MVDCSICFLHSDLYSQSKYQIKRTSIWTLRHHPDPAPLPGWLILDSNRHLSGPIEFSTSESSSWGNAVSMASKIVQNVTQCDRVYFIAFGEGARHLHLHLIPHMNGNTCTKSWNIADYYRDVLNNPKKAVDPKLVKKIVSQSRENASSINF